MIINLIIKFLKDHFVKTLDAVWIDNFFKIKLIIKTTTSSSKTQKRPQYVVAN